MQSLEDRRLESDLVRVYKVLTGKCNVDCNAWFERSSSDEQRTRTACDDLHLNQPFARLEIRRHFFTVRVIEHWNKLPYSIRASKSVRQFRTAVKKHLEKPSEARGRTL